MITGRGPPCLDVIWSLMRLTLEDLSTCWVSNSTVKSVNSKRFNPGRELLGKSVGCETLWSNSAWYTQKASMDTKNPVAMKSFCFFELTLFHLQLDYWRRWYCLGWSKSDVQFLLLDLPFWLPRYKNMMYPTWSNYFEGEVGSKIIFWK